VRGRCTCAGRGWRVVRGRARRERGCGEPWETQFGRMDCRISGKIILLTPPPRGGRRRFPRVCSGRTGGQLLAYVDKRNHNGVGIGSRSLVVCPNPGPMPSCSVQPIHNRDLTACQARQYQVGGSRQCCSIFSTATFHSDWKQVASCSFLSAVTWRPPHISGFSASEIANLAMRLLVTHKSISCSPNNRKRRKEKRTPR